jgi:hypothetical protein
MVENLYLTPESFDSTDDVDLLVPGDGAEFGSRGFERGSRPPLVS